MQHRKTCVEHTGYFFSGLLQYCTISAAEYTLLDQQLMLYGYVRYRADVYQYDCSVCCILTGAVCQDFKPSMHSLANAIP